MTVLKVSTTTSYICLLTKARSSRGRSHQAALPESQERERHRLKLISKTEKSRPSANKIVGQNDSMEDTLKNSTVGLVRLEDFQQRRKEIEEAKASQAACMSELKEQTKKVKKCTKAKLTLSFAIDDEEGDFSQEPRRRFSLIVKREEAERKEREQLRQEWLQQQDELKMEDIEITYSYWDGSGHRKSVLCKKGDAIANFLEICHQQFSELRGISVDNLMYIELKEDLMIPHHYIFYDFIVNKARGNSGLLFNFDVDDDVRLLSDAMMEKDESHAGKVVERGWYKRLTKRRRPRHLKSPPPMKPRQLPVRETQFQACRCFKASSRPSKAPTSPLITLRPAGVSGSVASLNIGMFTLGIPLSGITKLPLDKVTTITRSEGMQNVPKIQDETLPQQTHGTGKPRSFKVDLVIAPVVLTFAS
ncbi:hypothetical protein PISMIDRAFT_8797 [Pisolithus microcarpus 441]|uniref:FAM50A/XAP5 C-terminal domain-containing protein n=1 Tax=Pisolithus microcarpus 441 TaxID=765257 RepID=A0A0C9YNX7_9AGAM|nr:hypothetical protein PISMIDRAFT_8797 [Pisolithus microcarpus 441]